MAKSSTAAMPRDAGGTLWDWPNQQVVRADQSGPGVPAVVAATGATAGIPGTWTPPGSTPPATVAALQASSVTATPATAWTIGQYVQTGTAGTTGRAHWSATAWVSGAAP